MQNIEVKNLTYTYSKKTPYEKIALKDINLTINEGDFLGIIGHTGSGKSTFIQHINGLIKAQDGEIKVFDINLTQKKPKPDLRKLRQEVGMVFQYPEYQLFADTVEKDIAFGPKNLKLPAEEIKNRVRLAMDAVGLDYDYYKNRSPFDLSGGQKRRVAIAGVLAMKPKVLILDEHTAGLDPIGKRQILNLITNLKNTITPTIIVISHDINEITQYCNRLVVFNNAKIAFDLPINELFTHSEELLNMGLDIPLCVKVNNYLKANNIKLDGDIITPQDLITAIIKYKNQGGSLWEIFHLGNTTQPTHLYTD